MPEAADQVNHANHSVARLRQQRLARSTRPFLARGGPKGERCPGCRLRPSHCICAHISTHTTQAGICLLLHDAEMLKPSNTGWLIADLIRDCFAFTWARTEVAPDLLALLQAPQWQPYVVFPQEYVTPASRVVQTLPSHNIAINLDTLPQAGQALASKKPLFILLDGTWSEARKMFRKSPYLDAVPVLSLHPQQLSRYQLRRAKRSGHLCTAEVAALCLELAGEPQAALALQAHLELYTQRYLQAKQQLPPSPAAPTKPLPIGAPGPHSPRAAAR